MKTLNNILAESLLDDQQQLLDRAEKKRIF